MTRPLRTLHRYTWLLLSFALPVLLILSVAFRPASSRKITRKVEQPFTYHIRKTEDMNYTVTIDIRQSIPTASYLIYAKSGETSWMLGRVSGQGMYLFTSPKIFDRVFIYDAIHRIEISGEKVVK